MNIPRYVGQPVQRRPCMEHHKGFSGFDFVKEGHSAINIVETLERAITRLCTEGSGGPGPEWLDDGLKSHILNQVEVWCADAASNEWAAGRIARKGNFGNLVHISKDNTHASVRLALQVSLFCLF